MAELADILMAFGVSSTSRFPATRLRRLRNREPMRQLVREVRVTVKDLVQPIFVKAGRSIKQPIRSMPGQYQWSIDQLPNFVRQLKHSGIPAVFLFGVPAYKDDMGSASWHEQGIIQQSIDCIKQQAPELLIIADLCFCEYTSHGHCGVVKQQGDHIEIENDQTLTLLQKQALSLAKAGAEVIAPSGMMDGMVSAIRSVLDQSSYTQVSLWSYAVKYASIFYQPFREAAEGAPQFGDRRTYQMDPACGSQALREADLDVREGADALIIKPAQAYLDIVYRVKQAFTGVPVGAYQVSGAYAMLKAAADSGWLEAHRVVPEILTCMKRAGADFIISYYALEAAEWL